MTQVSAASRVPNVDPSTILRLIQCLKRQQQTGSCRGSDAGLAADETTVVDDDVAAAAAADDDPLFPRDLSSKA